MKKATRLLGLLLAMILCLSVLPIGAAAAGSGWQKIEGDWYYIENGSPANGWRKISGAWYYFVPEWGGIMLTGWMCTDPTFFSGGEGPFTGDWYHFSSSGKMDANKWVKESYTYEGTTYTDWYYMLGSGRGASGWQKIGGVWYYFDPDAGDAMVSGGMLGIPDKNGDTQYYYFKDSGALYTGWKELSFTDDDGDTFKYWAYFTSNGAVQNAWKKIGGSWYYFDGIYMLADGFYKFGDLEYYYFLPSGAMKTGWQKLPFQQEDGSTVYEWAYFTSNGTMKINGWQKDGGYWYYFEGAEYIAGRGKSINGKQYYFDQSGHMVTGWLHVRDDAGYYVGWQYYLSSGERVENDSVTINGKTYFFSDGWWHS